MPITKVIGDIFAGTPPMVGLPAGWNTADSWSVDTITSGPLSYTGAFPGVVANPLGTSNAQWHEAVESVSNAAYFEGAITSGLNPTLDDATPRTEVGLISRWVDWNNYAYIWVRLVGDGAGPPNGRLELHCGLTEVVGGVVTIRDDGLWTSWVQYDHLGLPNPARAIEFTLTMLNSAASTIAAWYWNWPGGVHFSVVGPYAMAPLAGNSYIGIYDRCDGLGTFGPIYSMSELAAAYWDVSRKDDPVYLISDETRIVPVVDNDVSAIPGVDENDQGIIEVTAGAVEDLGNGVLLVEA